MAICTRSAANSAPSHLDASPYLATRALQPTTPRYKEIESSKERQKDVIGGLVLIISRNICMFYKKNFLTSARFIRGGQYLQTSKLYRSAFCFTSRHR